MDDEKNFCSFSRASEQPQGRGLEVNSARQPCLSGVKRGVKAEYKSCVQKPHAEANGIKSRVPAS